ncbi:MAG: PA-phosphatase, partial [Bacteroidota bacterium]
MKLTIRYFLLFMLLFIAGCESIIQDEIFAPRNVALPADADAITWTLMPGGPLLAYNQISVPAPEAVSSAAYQAELATIQGKQKYITSEQRKAIEKWSTGGILQWNRFMRELVARYSLAPAPAADGSYPIPDAENPFGDPAFPFSNPPYSARAYSYVSVAQYQALQAAWYYKYLYNRPAPSAVDQRIVALVPSSTLPAYPSEDAVMSAVTAELLKVLFPAAVEEITLKAAEQRTAAILSGKASITDVSAGLALGKGIAALFTSRAAGDGMKNAVGTPAQWAVLEDTAKVHLTKLGRSVSGEIFWKSKDSPVRPPMLPFFGNVKGWILSTSDFNSLRPGPPPSTSSPEMAADLKEVRYYSENASRDRLRIVHFWADGGGTYTPPGHWNDIAANYIHKASWSEIRSARAFALLNMALHNAAVGCWD